MRKFSSRTASDGGVMPESEYPARARGEGVRADDSPREGADGGARAELAPDYAQLGEHVSSVLQAAKEAAKRIEQDARNQAEHLRDRVQQQAASKLADARRESEKLLFEAERLRAEAEKESKQTRERAEAYAAEKRRDADDDATALVARAEQVAKARASAAEERHRTLEANVELTEEQLRRLVSGLMDTASRLNDLMPPEPPSADEQPASAPHQDGLEETLAASVARQQGE